MTLLLARQGEADSEELWALPTLCGFSNISFFKDTVVIVVSESG